MSGVNLKLDNSEYTDVPAEIATGVLAEFSNLKNEIKRLQGEKDNSRVRKDMNKEYELDGTVYTNIDDMYKDMCAYKKKYKDMMAKYESASAKTDALELQLSERTDEQDLSKLVSDRVKQRRTLEGIARKQLSDFSLERFDSLSDLEIKQEIVANSGLAKERYEGYSELQLDAVIEVLSHNNKKRQDNYEAQQKAFSSLSTRHHEQNNYDSELAKMVQGSIDTVENAWKIGSK